MLVCFRRDFLLESQLEKIGEMESRMTKLLDTLDRNIGASGNIVAVRDKEVPANLPLIATKKLDETLVMNSVCPKED